MQLAELSAQVYHSTAPGLGRPKEYINYDSRVRQAVSEFDGIKISTEYNWQDISLDWIRLSVVLSDFTSWYMTGPSYQITYRSEGYEGDWPTEIELPTRLFEPGGFFCDVTPQDDGSPNIFPAIMYPNGEGMRGLVRDLQPLAEAGRLMIRPKQLLMGNLNKPDEHKAIARIFMIESDTPGASWAAHDKSQESIPIRDCKIDNKYLDVSGNFMLPYLMLLR